MRTHAHGDEAGKIGYRVSWVPNGRDANKKTIL